MNRTYYLSPIMHIDKKKLFIKIMYDICYMYLLNLHSSISIKTENIKLHF